VIPSSYVQEEIHRYQDKIKDKDLEQLAVVKKLGLKYLISYDRDLELFEEYKTPRKFIEARRFNKSANFGGGAVIRTILRRVLGKK